VHDAASVVWCAECTQGLVGAPFFHDCRCDFPLFRHPRSLCGLVLSIFSIFPGGPGCEQQGYLVEGGNEVRCGGLGHLNGGGGRSRGVVLRLLFSAFVIVNEGCMCLHECVQVGVGPCVVGLECLTAAYPAVLVGEACEERDEFAGGRVKCC
jgi:hypothetical protein